MNVTKFIRIVPTLKVNNRKINESFYTETLGMKPLLEESAFLSLGDETGVEKLVLEESPSMRTRKVRGAKKLEKIELKVENPKEVEALLARTPDVHALFKGEKGYAFEIFSPEGDLFLVHAENQVSHLQPITEVPDVSGLAPLCYLSQFEVSGIAICLPKERKSFLTKQMLADIITFTEGEGVDLLAEEGETWDLSMLQFQVQNLDLASLQEHFQDTGYFIPKTKSFFLSKDSNHIQLWFEEA